MLLDSGYQIKGQALQIEMQNGGLFIPDITAVDPKSGRSSLSRWKGTLIKIGFLENRNGSTFMKLRMVIYMFSVII